MNNTSNNLAAQELLKELKYLVEALRNDPLDTSQLELDIMKDKIRVIYDILSEVKIKKIADQFIEKKNITHDEPEILQVEEKEPTPKAFPKLVLEIDNDVEIEIEPDATTDLKEHILSQSTEPTLNLFEESVENTDNQEKISVGGKIADKKPIESISDVIQSKKIVSLKLAIGINDKFFFLNELFDGKMNEYNDAIEKMDQKNTFKDAMEYFGLMKENKNWDEESEAYNQLKEFLERKFN